MTYLVVVNGAPGTGKTNLMRRLEKDLTLPGVGKDDIKEFLFERIGYSDRNWSRIVGQGSVEALYAITKEFLSADQSFIIENAFWPKFARTTVETIAHEHKSTVVEVYCTTDNKVRMERFQTRAESQERHAGHVDGGVVTDDISQYGPLTESPIEYDTTEFSEENYVTVLNAIRIRLGNNNA